MSNKIIQYTLLQIPYTYNSSNLFFLTKCTISFYNSVANNSVTKSKCDDKA